MKRIFRKNHIIITALALMIAVAGYVSYTRTNPGETVKTGADSVADTYDISDEDIAAQVFTDTEDNTQAAADTEDAKETDDAKNAEDTQSAENTDPDAAETKNPGETVLTSADAQTVGFAAEVKMNREQMRSKNKETLLDVINNASISEAQKQDAIQSMIAMTDIAERENAAEILLEAKGFSDVVVSISDETADVVLNMGDVTDAKRAQVEDIVKRKTGISAENIVITPIAENSASQK